jgi:hypothetical protein
MKSKKSLQDDSPELLKIFAEKDEAVLLALLSEYAKRWRHSDNQIWSVGAVFIPLSISGVAFGFGDKYRTLGIAIFSTFLIWIWYMISSALRSWIDLGWKMYAAVETTILKLNPPRLKAGVSEVAKLGTEKTISVRSVSWLIPTLITIGWIFITILAFALP